MELNHAELKRACGLSLALCSAVLPKELRWKRTTPNSCELVVCH